MAPAAPRLYELRLASVGDGPVRDGVAAILDRRIAPSAKRIERSALAHGLVVHLPLDDADAALLLRELYATGIAPAAVILRPVGIRGEPQPAAAIGAVFAERGGRFVPTWNWTAFVFGPLWYLRRGLYGKGLVLLGLSVCPFFTLTLTLLVSVAVLVYCGLVGNWDDYLWKVRGTQWWR